MEILYQAALLAFGLFILIKGADYFIEGSSGIATDFGVSPLFIGLTFVAFGTSAPEAAVSFNASLSGSNDITLGNIMGSNIANTGLVLGLTAIFYPVAIKRSSLNKEIPFIILTTLTMVFLMFDTIFTDATENYISLSDGLVLLMFFLIFIEYTFNLARQDKKDALANGLEKAPRDKKNTRKNWLFAILGLIGVVFGGELVVSNSVELANAFGISQKFIAVTIIAVGTSLPELVTSLMAGRKKQDEIAIGNIIGSSIFNILFVLGGAAVFSPLRVDLSYQTDAAVVLILIVAVWFFAVANPIFLKRKSITNNRINKGEGALLFLVYIAYIGITIYRL
jgi:cation:H+ antiporter